MGADINSILIGSLALTIAAVLVGIGLTAARRRSGPDLLHTSLVDNDLGSQVAANTAASSDLADVGAFTLELFAAPTIAEVQRVVAARLPTLLGTRRVWVSAAVAGRRHLIVAEDKAGQREPLVDEAFQEWTTVPLRIGRDTVGIIGVDTATARTERARRIIERVAPFIGQALHNATVVDTLRETSLLDSLTGTGTRREGLARLHAELKRAQRTGATMAVMLLDLDRFKSINDRHGHATGDAVLAAVGLTLQRTLRASDIRARWGGEEFLIVLPDTDVDRAQVVANGLLRNIAAATVPTAEGPVGTTTSIGLTMSRAGETNVEAIVQRADVALYQAKNAGRAGVQVVLGDATAPPIRVPSPLQKPGEATTLPFPDRRNPNRPDRRRVPGPGRRATDPKI